MPAPYRILFIASWYPSRANATLGNFVERHAQAVAAMHSVHVLYVAPLRGAAATPEVVHHQGVTATIVYFRPGWFSFFRKWRAWLRGIAHLQSTGQWNFDLVHLNVIWPAGWQAHYLRWKYRLPYVITEHWTGYAVSERKPPSWFIRMFSSWVARGASVICPVSHNLGQGMQKLGMHSKYITVPNVVDTSVFTPASWPSGPLRLLHISSLYEPQKNVSGILRAFKNALDKGAHVHLSLGGDGPVEHYRYMAAELGIAEECIHFFSELAPDEVAAMMRKCHALIMFSNYENLPCVILEAMACGLPVVTSAVGGIAEHVNNERGVLISPRDEHALAQAIVKLTSDIHRFKREALQQYTGAHFSMNAVAQKFTEVYNQVMSKPGV